MFASRWAQSAGHSGWGNSVCVHAVSDNNPIGPYVDKGMCWPDNEGGKGHNVTANQLPDGTYSIIVSTTRPGDVFTSSSLDGPWAYQGSITIDANGYSAPKAQNLCFVVRPDGSYLMTSTHGVLMLSTTGIMGPYKVQGPGVYPANVPGFTGTSEDPVIWYSGGQYHMVADWYMVRKAMHMVSPDGIHNWTGAGLAYDPTSDFVRYTDGTVNHWYKMERPGVLIEDGHVTHFTFAVIDVEKSVDTGNDGHGSKVLVVPFDGVSFDGAGADGGAGGTGGSSGSGGATGSGGRTGTGGATAVGGATGTGGAVGTGGKTATGGTPTSGGTPGTGGTAGIGGSTETSGAAGGVVGTGGTVGSGGGPATGGSVAARRSSRDRRKLRNWWDTCRWHSWVRRQRRYGWNCSNRRWHDSQHRRATGKQRLLLSHRPSPDNQLPSSRAFRASHVRPWSSKKEPAPMSSLKTFAKLFVVACFVGVMSPARATAADGGTKTLIDYFQPTPIVCPLTSSTWGAAGVLPRDTCNGLEDSTNKQCQYWDGKILKGADGKYHMYAGQWPQNKGFCRLAQFGNCRGG